MLTSNTIGPCSEHLEYKGYKVYRHKIYFFANLPNKDKFLHLLEENLRQEGCGAIFADKNSDVEITEASIQRSLATNVTLIGEEHESFSTPFVLQLERLAT